VASIARDDPSIGGGHVCWGSYDDFTNRALNIWNSLPNWVVMPDTVNTFKNRLDRFWRDQPIIYDFKAQIQGTGNRSWY